ncbi:putative DNA-binding protein [Periweissella beninensis]|uniref:putative DNA-binding protein n=1 Tax=Periweissella beninensis TaxID=504936 RepID=UPI0021A4ADDE|nr:putative DNA-binding protein [Periweissella beninensis]MCT4396806.1 putative DNA-binding protein [Periweissella beninensis]
MEIEKNNRINSLFEFYQPLLTKKQYEYMELYYGDDYSLGEIAEEFAVSRQAVYDNLKRTEKLLEMYEQKIHLLNDFEKRQKLNESLLAYIKITYPEDKYLLELATVINNDEE